MSYSTDTWMHYSKRKLQNTWLIWFCITSLLIAWKFKILNSNTYINIICSLFYFRFVGKCIAYDLRRKLQLHNNIFKPKALFYWHLRCNRPWKNSLLWEQILIKIISGANLKFVPFFRMSISENYWKLQ